MGWLRRRIGLALAAIVLAGAPAAAHADVVHVHWRSLHTASDNTQQAPVTDGRYVYVPTSSSGSGTVTDSRNWSTWPLVPPAGCDGIPVLGSAHLLNVCGDLGAETAWVYSLTRRTWTQLPPATLGACHQHSADPNSQFTCDPEGVGSWWAAFSSGCPQYKCYGGGTQYNLRTGKTASWDDSFDGPGDPPDLNVPEANYYPPAPKPPRTPKLCTPLRGADFIQWLAPRQGLFDSGTELWIQRCGSRAKLVLTRKLVDLDYFRSGHALIWLDYGKAHALRGYDWRRRARLTIPLPVIRSPKLLFQIRNRVYLQDGSSGESYWGVLPAI